MGPHHPRGSGSESSAMLAASGEHRGSAARAAPGVSQRGPRQLHPLVGQPRVSWEPAKRLARQPGGASHEPVMAERGYTDSQKHQRDLKCGQLSPDGPL
jgi:hypothetical protein